MDQRGQLKSGAVFFGFFELSPWTKGDSSNLGPYLAGSFMELRAKDQEICLAYRLEIFRLEDFASRLVLTRRRDLHNVPRLSSLGRCFSSVAKRGPGIYTMCHAFVFRTSIPVWCLQGAGIYTMCHVRRLCVGLASIGFFNVSTFQRWKFSTFQDFNFMTPSTFQDSTFRPNAVHR